MTITTPIPDTSAPPQATPSIEIQGRRIGPGHPCFVIAEIGINHNGDLGMAMEMMKVAAHAGADAVKFQKRDLASLYRKDVLEDPNVEGQAFAYLLPWLKRCELGEGAYEKLKAEAQSLGVMFLCTAWDIPSVDFLQLLGVPAFKTASADLTNFPLLDYLCDLQKPLIVSTGMSREEEIDRTVAFLKEKAASFALLHCNSTYPCNFRDIHLNYMVRLGERHGVPVGWSGHERGVAVSAAAVALGASIVERHFTLDRTLPGPDHAASLEPIGLEKMIKYIRTIEESLGKPVKRYSRGEDLQRETLSKSLVALVDLPAGTVVEKHHLAAKSPGRGLSPQLFFDLIGKKSTRDIKAETPLTEKDFA